MFNCNNGLALSQIKIICAILSKFVVRQRTKNICLQIIQLSNRTVNGRNLFVTFCPYFFSTFLHPYQHPFYMFSKILSSVLLPLLTRFSVTLARIGNRPFPLCCFSLSNDRVPLQQSSKNKLLAAPWRNIQKMEPKNGNVPRSQQGIPNPRRIASFTVRIFPYFVK